jgi:hypothetical protein
MGEDVDFSGWELPPLEDDPDRQPPPERPPYSGVSIGSDLAGLRHAGSGALESAGRVAGASRAPRTV